jgi:gliding motility-associated-like protein
LLLTILVLGLSFTIAAQPVCVPVFVTEFSGAGLTEAHAVKSLPDGTILVAGRATSTATSTDFDGLITKLSSTGTPIWSFLIGGPGNDIFTGITTLTDGSAILYGSTASFGYALGKAWIVHIDPNGAVLWSQQLGAPDAGADRLKAIQQYTDGDIIGTMNINDSSTNSDPIVFKMGLDGTVRWGHRFDNGGDDSYTSIAFSGDTLYAAGYYTAAGVKQGVIAQLKAEDGAYLSSVNIYRPDPGYQEEVTGLQIYNNMISYGLYITQNNTANPDFNDNGIYLTRTDLAGNRLLKFYALNFGEINYLWPMRTSDNGFVILRTYTGNVGSPSLVKMNPFGLMDWGVGMTIYNYAEVSPDVDTTADGGYITAGYYSTYLSNPMRIVKLNALGEFGACGLNNLGMFTDTTTSLQQPFTWASQSTYGPLQSTVSPLAPILPLTPNPICSSSLCTPYTPVPAGCNKTFRIEYGAGRTSLLRDATPTTDGGQVGVGSVGFEQEGLLVKLNSNGDVAWAKSYEAFFHNLIFRRILPTADGNLLVMADDYYTINHGGNQDVIMMKIDINGNLLWAHTLFRPAYSYGIQVADIAATPDNGFIVVMDDGYGTGGVYEYAIRYDANANIVWQQQIIHGFLASVYKSIFISPDAVFIGFDSYPGDPGSGYFGVDRLDPATGNLVWSQTYGITNNSTKVNRIFAVNDSIYLFLYNYYPFPSATINHLLVKLDAAGNLFQSLDLVGDPLSPSNVFPLEYLDASPPTVTLTPDQDFVLTERVLVGADTALNMTRILQNGTVLWSRNLGNTSTYTPANIHPLGKGVLVLGTSTTLVPSYGDFNTGFMLKLDSSGQIEPGATSTCLSTDRPFAVSTNTSVALKSNINNTATPIVGLTATPTTLTTTPVPLYPDLFCYNPAICGDVTLQQKGQVCSAGDTLVYYLANAANCSAAATWNYDQTFFRPAALTGDSIQLISQRSGSTTVNAQVQGYCSYTAQSLPVAITFSSATLSLGPDTLLCPGNKIILHAGPGYVTYLWSDNSTDSTLTISANGTYTVTTTDQCGNDHSASVLVSPANLSFLLTGDTISCNNSPVTLHASSGYSNYQWTSNSQSAPAASIQPSGDSALVTPAPTTPILYFVNAQKWTGCTLTDSLLVTPLSSPAIQLPADTSLCAGDSLLLDAGAAFTHYTWNNGDTTNRIFARQAGNYYLSALYANGCSSKDTFRLLSVYPEPQPSLNKNTVLCFGTDRELNAGPGYAQYLWNDGSTTSSLTVSSLGSYWVRVTDQHGCTASDTVNILSTEPPPSGFLPADTTICQYDKLTLTTLVPFRTYAWNDQSTGPSITLNNAGLYWVEVTDSNGCVGKDSIIVTQKQCLVGLFVPNAFTPNGDGHNDLFRPMLYGNMVNLDFIVFNRWGQKVFETQTPTGGWDGSINGTPSPTGTYVWYCRYQLDGQSEKTAKGTVILIR